MTETREAPVRGTLYIGNTAWCHRTEPDDHHAPVIEDKTAKDATDHPGTNVYERCGICQNAIAWHDGTDEPRGEAPEARPADGWNLTHSCGGFRREITRLNKGEAFMCVVCGEWCRVEVTPESRPEA